MRQPESTELIDEAEEIMRNHTGFDNAITARELSDRLGIEDAEGFPNTRDVLKYLLAERGMPIGSGNQGSFLIETEEEFIDYVENLDNRIRGIMDRRQAVMKVYRGDDVSPDEINL